MIYAGIDVAKLKLDVCFDAKAMQTTKKKKFAVFPNTQEGIDALCEQLGENRFVVFESTGPYSKLLYKRLCEKQIPCRCENPYRVLQFMRATGRQSKTDKTDAEGLSLYGYKMEPEPSQFLNETDLKLNELVHAREVIIKDIRAYKNRTDVPYASEAVNKVYADLIDVLEQKLKEINQKINEFMLEEKKHKERLDLLTTIPGIGPITGATLLAYCPELGTLGDKQVGALAGLATCTRQSGTTYMRGHIGGGRKRLRNALFMCTLVAVRCDPEIRAFYERLKGQGKPFKVAITAVMRKLLIRANSVLKRRVSYQVRGTLPPRLKKVA